MAPTLCTNTGNDVILTFYFIEGQVYSAAPYLANSNPKNQKCLHYTKENSDNFPRTQCVFQELVQKIETSDDFTDDELENHCQDEKTLQRLEVENVLPCIDDSVEELFADSEHKRKANRNGSAASIGDSVKVLCSETASISSSYVPDDFGSMESGDLPEEHVPMVSDVLLDEYVPTVSSTPNEAHPFVASGNTVDEYCVPDAVDKDYYRLEAENFLPCIDDSVEELFADSEHKRKANRNGSIASIGDSVKVLCSETASVSSSYVPDDFRSMASGDLPEERFPMASDVLLDEYDLTVSSTPNEVHPFVASGNTVDECCVPDSLTKDYYTKQVDGSEDKKKKNKFLSRIRKTIDGFVSSAEKSATLPVQRTPSFAYCSTTGLFANEHTLHSFYAKSPSTSLAYLDLGGIGKFPTNSKKEKWWRFWQKR